MRLLTNWKRILQRAWSVRLILLAGVLSGLELIVPLYATDMPRGIFAMASLIVTCAATVARIVAQKEVG